MIREVITFRRHHREPMVGSKGGHKTRYLNPEPEIPEIHKTRTQLGCQVQKPDISSGRSGSDLWYPNYLENPKLQNYYPKTSNCMQF
jgi:hypothetical protein